MLDFDPNKQIVFEDNHLIVINKLPSQIVQGDKTGDIPLSDHVKKYIKEKYNKPGNVYLGVAHRLDRPVSGLVIFAKTSKALSRLNTMLRENEITKKYWAVVKNLPPKEQGVLQNYLFKDEKRNKSIVVNKSKTGSKFAELKYKHVFSSNAYHLIEVELITGRHHQIRAQLANAGCPIKGDLKYGFPRSNPTPFIHLHARSLLFRHPVKKEPLVLQANPPDDVLWNLFVHLDKK